MYEQPDRPAVLKHGRDRVEPVPYNTSPCTLKTRDIIVCCIIPRRRGGRRGIHSRHVFFTLLGPQARFGDAPLKFYVVRPQTGTAVLKVLSVSFPLKNKGLQEGFIKPFFSTSTPLFFSKNFFFNFFFFLPSILFVIFSPSFPPPPSH